MSADSQLMEMARRLRQMSNLQRYEVLCGHGQAGLDAEAAYKEVSS